MKKVDPELAEITLQWFTKAREDLWMDQKVCEDPDAPSDLIAFHAQQAAEKCLKGLLTLYQVEFPKIHDLGALIALLQPVLEKLPIAIESADRLSAFAVITRYPHEAEGLTSDDAREAFQLANAIYDESAEILKRHGLKILASRFHGNDT